MNENEYDINTVRERSANLLMYHNVAKEDALILVDHLITADLHGKASHGLGTRFEMLLRQAKDGRGNAPFEVVRDTKTTVAIDGHDGFGYLQAQKCVDILLDRMSGQVMCAVALSNTGHTGRLGHYVSQGARAGVITMAFSHCTPLMAPYGGTSPLLGTNPLAFGFPRPHHNPVVVDFGCAEMTLGEVERYRKAGKNLPHGCALGPEGEMVNKPEKAMEGCLLPFGGRRGGALAVAVQILAGALTGSPAVPPKGKGYGLLLIGLQKNCFCSEQDYDREIKSFIEQYLQVNPRAGKEIRLPGDNSANKYSKALEKGIMYVPPHIADIIGLG